MMMFRSEGAMTDNLRLPTKIRNIRPCFEPVPKPGPVRWFHAGQWTVIEEPRSAPIPTCPAVLGKHMRQMDG